MENLTVNYVEACSVVLFGVGFMTLLMHSNMIKKIIGLNIMDTAIFLFFIAKGYISEGTAPIVVGELKEAGSYINPVPTSLMLTGIVVAVSMTALGLALIIKLHEKYGSIEMDEILRMREVQ